MNLVPSNTQALVQRTDALLDLSEKLLQAYDNPLTEEWWNSLSKEWQEVLYAHVRLWKEKGILLTEEFIEVYRYSGMPFQPDIFYIYEEYFKERTKVHYYQNFLKDLSLLNILYLYDTKLNDYTPVKKLKKIISIDLGNSQITDISFLQSLTSLTYLSVYGNQITNISFLQNLTKLNYLGLSLNKITDISPLQNLTNLNYLKLGHNQITDISPLQNSTKLNYLDLYFNKITDISPLQNLTKLNYLDLGHNQITDISPLQNLTKLTCLGLSRNKITDVYLEFLNSLYNLKDLHLYENPIKNIPVDIFDRFSRNILLEVRAYLEKNS